MMNDDFQSKDSLTITFSADTNGLGYVAVQIHGVGKVVYLTADEARTLGQKLLDKATEADFQNTAL